MSTQHPLVLFTPTYGADLEYFRFLRESAQRWCPEIPHVTVVQSEDLERFAEFRSDPSVVLLSSDDVLPTADRWRRHRPRPLDRLLRRRHISGWYFQQLMKLAGPDIVAAPVYLCIDSDHFFVRPFEVNDVLDDLGRVILLEHSYQPDGEIAEWNRQALAFFGLPTTPDPRSNFIESSVPLETGTVMRMRAFIEARHGAPWYKAMADHQIIEYAAYGIFATRIDGREGVGASIGNEAYFSNGIWEADTADGIARRLWDNTAPANVKLTGIYSATQMPTAQYRSAVERIWARSEAEVNGNGLIDLTEPMVRTRTE